METRVGIRFETRTSTRPTAADARAAILAKPGFGKYFSDHMVTARWTEQTGWVDGQLIPYAALPLDPGTLVLHYAQSIFEGFKAYRQADGNVASFRPHDNARRFRSSAERLALPDLPVPDFVAASDLLISTDRDWVPSQDGSSLYIRPFLYGSEKSLSVRPAHEATLVMIASPVASYFERGDQAVSIWVTEHYVRAVPGGTGAAKCAGNYAASLLAQREAAEHGCDQVLFLDALEHRWVEELGGMNIFFVRQNGSLITPGLTGTILPGITRDSIITLARELGHEVEERQVSFEEWREGIASGTIVEAFACGTAAVVTPVGRVRWTGGDMELPSKPFSESVTGRLRTALLDIQYGRAADRHGWMHRIA